MSKKTKLPLYVVPEAWAVLYVHPMVKEYRKKGRNCGNCFMWVSSENKCIIHSTELSIPDHAVCGYHVPGNPMQTSDSLENLQTIQHVDQKVSGLEFDIPLEGTLCGNCRFYSPSKKKEAGYCGAVAKENTKLPIYKARVMYYGCCARWEKK